MPGPVEILPPKPPLQRAIPPQPKPAENSEKPDDFKQALEDATKKPADQTSAPDPKPADAKTAAKKTAGKPANKAEGKARSPAAAAAGRLKRTRGERRPRGGVGSCVVGENQSVMPAGY